MKNMAVLKRFLSYLVGMLLGGVIFYLIAYGAKFFMGDPSYGIIGILGAFLIWFTYTMAKSQVEREAKWAKEREERLTKV